MSADDARAVAPIFDPARLRLAREASGLRKGELAERLEVSPAAISQFESGSAKPSAATLAKLALALKFPVGFFAYEGEREDVSLDVSDTFFRSLRSTRQIDRQRAVAHAALTWEVVQHLERRVHLPELNLPDGLHVPAEADVEDERIEGAAEAVRRHWGLANGPVDHVVRRLELNGIVVTRFRLDAQKVDAFSRWFGMRPLIVLGDDKGDAARSRFDAAHELGHLVMHPDPEPGNRSLENQAQRFAAAFMMPREAISGELPRGRVDWMRIMELKRSWGVSIAALLYRAKALGLLSQAAYENAMKTMARRGWRRDEPAPLREIERPSLFNQALALLEQKGFGLTELERDTRLPKARLLKILGSETDERPPVFA